MPRRNELTKRSVAETSIQATQAALMTAQAMTVLVKTQAVTTQATVTQATATQATVTQVIATQACPQCRSIADGAKRNPRRAEAAKEGCPTEMSPPAWCWCWTGCARPPRKFPNETRRSRIWHWHGPQSRLTSLDCCWPRRNTGRRKEDQNHPSTQRSSRRKESLQEWFRRWKLPVLLGKDTCWLQASKLLWQEDSWQRTTSESQGGALCPCVRRWDCWKKNVWQTRCNVSTKSLAMARSPASPSSCQWKRDGQFLWQPRKRTPKCQSWSDCWGWCQENAPQQQRGTSMDWSWRKTTDESSTTPTKTTPFSWPDIYFSLTAHSSTSARNWSRSQEATACPSEGLGAWKIVWPTSSTESWNCSWRWVLFLACQSQAVWSQPSRSHWKLNEDDEGVQMEEKTGTE